MASSSESECEPGTNRVQAQRQILQSTLRLIDAALDATVRDGDASSPLQGHPTVLRVTRSLIHVAGISGHSLLALTAEVGLGVRDCYPIVRGVVEAATNVGFIMAEGASAAERAERHAAQKAFRDLSRTWKSPTVELQVGWTGTLPATERERLSKIAEEFTTRRGTEKSWTDTTLAQRIDKITEVFPKVDTVLLVSAAMMVYRHASEIVHGSYFGALYFYGVTSPRSDKLDLRRAMIEHQETVLLAAILAYACLLSCFASYTGAAGFSTASEAELKKLHELVDLARP